MDARGIPMFASGFLVLHVPILFGQAVVIIHRKLALLPQTLALCQEQKRREGKHGRHGCQDAGSNVCSQT